MLRFALAAALGFAAITLAGVTPTTTAQEKKDDKKKDEKKTLEGTLVCSKCKLGETKDCGQALIVKDGDKKITYYLVDKAGKEPYHAAVCNDDVEKVKVTGKIVEKGTGKDKKMMIEDAKVELPKK